VSGVARACVVIALCACHEGVASAQSPEGRVEVAVGASWVGSSSLGSRDANETTSTLAQLPLFSTSTRLAGAPSVEGRVGWRLSRTLMVEGDASYGRPELQVTITNDAEAGLTSGSVTAAERLEQFTAGGSLVWYPPVGQSSRLAPFLTAGVGYLRQLHETATLVQTGRYYQFGGGIAVPLTSRPTSRLKTIGVRIDARGLVRVDGVAFDSSARVVPSAGASLFIRF
jgi:hypothetical protein